MAAGVGLTRAVRRGPKIVPGGATRLLLVGGTFAEGLAPLLRVLAKEQKVPFSSVLAPSTGKTLRTGEWAGRPELGAALASFRPTLVVVALDVPATDRVARSVQAAALRRLLTAIQAAGAAVLWIGPPVAPKTARGSRSEPDYFPTGTALTLPRGPDGVQPTVAGYAGWAGALWQWLS